MTDNKHQQISQRDFSWESLPQEHTHILVEHAIVVQAYNPRTQETEVERLHVQHQPGLQRKNLSQKIQCLVNLMMIEFLKIATFGIRYRWKRDPPPPISYYSAQHCNQKQLQGATGLFPLTTPRTQYVTKKSQHRNSRQEPRNRHWNRDCEGVLATGLLPRLSHPTHGHWAGVAPLRMSWTLPHQSLVEKMAHRQANPTGIFSSKWL